MAEKVKKASATWFPSNTSMTDGLLNYDFRDHGLLAVTTFKYEAVIVIKIKNDCTNFNDYKISRFFSILSLFLIGPS